MKRIGWILVTISLLLSLLPLSARATDLEIPAKSALLMDVATGSLRGMGSSVQPMIISILGICGLRLLWVATVCRIPPYDAIPATVYVSYPLSWLVTLMFQSAMFIYAMRKLNRNEIGGK